MEGEPEWRAVIPDAWDGLDGPSMMVGDGDDDVDGTADEWLRRYAGFVEKDEIAIAMPLDGRPEYLDASDSAILVAHREKGDQGELGRGIEEREWQLALREVDDRVEEDADACRWMHGWLLDEKGQYASYTRRIVACLQAATPYAPDR